MSAASLHFSTHASRCTSGLHRHTDTALLKTEEKCLPNGVNYSHSRHSEFRRLNRQERKHDLIKMKRPPTAPTVGGLVLDLAITEDNLHRRQPGKAPNTGINVSRSNLVVKTSSMNFFPFLTVLRNRNMEMLHVEPVSTSRFHSRACSRRLSRNDHASLRIGGRT